ncbi:HCO3 transporter family-domain-containing protein [Lipomyces tetrasporus]|uniref:HCO3 transporter family-domain-containing protein n=1 Tax=Lipomyces tetrasporus TaxID=54092 RepID=A0AAD7QWU6_9ASCO|nr:HCO3 transporter family-domain-containing protein [Lipomyces tetrasporus]KAJ8102366.1 HCO3 transporter family-domain-containing protein [Lipomyces tetrasporus]
MPSPSAGSRARSAMTPEKTHDSYIYDGLRGWRSYRPFRPGWGMYHDVKRRLPYYWSDITDAFTYKTFASTVRMYFVNLLPALAYTLDMYRRTGEFFGVNEAIFSSALAAMVVSILGAQPLTIYDPSIYPQFMCWTAIWAAIFHWLVALWNMCDYMRYATEFSSESFGMYVGIIYIEERVSEFSTKGTAAGYLSCMIAILYFATIYALEKLGSSTIWKPWCRSILADFIPGNLKAANIGRNVSSLTAHAREFPLKKPGGFHWDFFLLGCTTFIAGILGLLMPNGLAPQAPVHTDSLTVYETELAIIATDEGEGAEVRRPIVNAVAVVEQRVSHFLMGLALIGTMTGPLLIVFHTIPAAVLAGVFFVLGWGSIESNGIVGKLFFLFREESPCSPSQQLVGVAACVAISETIAAIGFPILICLLIPLRVLCLPKWFTQKELEVMDDLIANNKAVLASLGDAPRLPDGVEAEDYGLERRYSEHKRGVPRQRAGSIHR